MSRPLGSDRNVLLWVGRSLFGGGLWQCLAAGWVLCAPPRLPGCHGDVFSAGELKQKGVALQPVNQILQMLQQYLVKVWRLHNFRQLLRIIFLIRYVVLIWDLRIIFSFCRSWLLRKILPPLAHMFPVLQCWSIFLENAFVFMIKIQSLLPFPAACSS